VDEFGGYVKRVGDSLQSQLRVTAWPGVALPIPDTYRVESRLTDEGVIVPCPRGEYGVDWVEEAVELNGETYLELGGVDLDDPNAIFAFVQKYGPLGGWDAYLTIMRHAPYAVANMYGPRLNEPLEHAKRTRALREDRSETVYASDAHKFHLSETVDEFRFVARCLRDLTAAWRMFREGRAASEAEWVSPHPTQLVEFFTGDGFPVFLLDGLLPDYFLRPFTPHLAFHWTPPLPAGPVYSDIPPSQGPLNIEPARRAGTGQLYSICALELFNHMVENAEYLICGNENCQQKNFVHQQGRKKNWHRSSGVLYCSPACAHAVAQRRYRQGRRNR